MTFFSRPDLDNIQFKQGGNSKLTLSGKTEIATTTGLTLSNGNGVQIPITVSGATGGTSVGNVLTYDGSVVKLLPSGGDSGGTIYWLDSPTTITVGGLDMGSDIYGQSISEILRDILVPVVEPELDGFSSSFSISPSTSPLEVGTVLMDIEGSSSFYKGSVNPVYHSGPSVRTGDVIEYRYTDMYDNEYIETTNSLSNDITFSGLFTIDEGNNTFTMRVKYDEGEPPKRSDGSEMTGDTIMSGVTTPINKTLLGIYPYFWGIVEGGEGATKPEATQSLIDDGNKVVDYSSGYLTIDFQAETSHYLWFAVPQDIPIKTEWQGSNSPNNKEDIPGSLFQLPEEQIIDSPDGNWSGVSYNFYISEYATKTYSNGQPYTITFKE